MPNRMSEHGKYTEGNLGSATKLLLTPHPLKEEQKDDSCSRQTYRQVFCRNMTVDIS